MKNWWTVTSWRPILKFVFSSKSRDHATNEYTRNASKSKHLFFERFKMALYNDGVGDIGKGQNGATSNVEHEEKSNFQVSGQRVDIKEFLTATNGEELESRKVLEEALRFMAQHAMAVLKEKLDGIQRDEVQWIVTVPAIWSDRAKSVMKTAAVSSGMVDDTVEGQLIIAFEPDCASLSIQHEINEQLRLRHRKQIEEKRERLKALRNVASPQHGDEDDDVKQREVSYIGFVFVCWPFVSVSAMMKGVEIHVSGDRAQSKSFWKVLVVYDVVKSLKFLVFVSG